MIQYAKGNEPAGLAQTRSTPGAVWSSPPNCFNKQAIREALVRDQQGVCAYCERRIKSHYTATGELHDGSIRVEHWHARGDRGPHFVWTNLLGVCKGYTDDSEHPERTHRRRVLRVKTCDASRPDNTPLHLHPVPGHGLEPRAHLRYLGSGKIVSDDDRATADIKTLALNAPHLVRGRASAFDTFRTLLGAYTLGDLRRQLSALEAAVTVPEFSEPVRQFIEHSILRWRSATRGAAPPA